jgi:hypothetical protein
VTLLDIKRPSNAAHPHRYKTVLWSANLRRGRTARASKSRRMRSAISAVRAALERWGTSGSTEKTNFAKRIRRDRPAGVPRGDRLVLCRVSDTGPLMIYPPVLKAGVRKPSGKEPAGVGGWLAVYGDLMGRPSRRG